jgi:membrane associated rhomboid family serine protease
MTVQRSLSEELRYQYQFGGMHIRLILFNLLVFLGIHIIEVIGRLSGHNWLPILEEVFMFNTNPTGFLHHPWGIITSIFAHFDFFHFLSNMLFLYFSGKLFLQYFSNKRLLHVYVIGGLFGGLFEFLAQTFLHYHQQDLVVVGASGSIMAVFIALAVHQPMLQVNLFGAFPVRLILIAGVYILYDFIKIGKDNIAHLAHLGGALLGYLSVYKLHSSANIINKSEVWVQSILSYLRGKRGPKSKMKVKKGGARVKTDEDYLAEKKQKQEKIDRILDKISKSGYESLTKAEKEFLFSQSKNG